MACVNTYEAKTHLSRLLRRVRAGEEIVIAAAGRPVARLVPIAPDAGPRLLGGDEGVVWDAEDFNAPLPNAVLDPFHGVDGTETAGVRSGRPRRRTTGARRAHRA